jgi:predicted nucleic acid-binding protein
MLSTPSVTKRRRVMAEVVIDASAMVDLLLGGPVGDAVAARISDVTLHCPAHLDAEILSALGRLHRSNALTAPAVTSMLTRLADAPIERHSVADLLLGAWGRRRRLRLADALYVELANTLDLLLVTTDRRLKPTGVADVVTA